MDFSELISIIGNTCFPVAICSYILIRLEKQLVHLTSSVNLLNTIVSTKLGIVIKTEKEK